MAPRGNSSEKLIGKELLTLLSFYGADRRNHGTTVGETRAKVPPIGGQKETQIQEVLFSFLFLTP